MLSKPNETLQAKKTKSFSSKGSIHTRPKTMDGTNTKDKISIHTNIPQPITIMRTRSCEKIVKSESVYKKSSDTKEQVSTKTEKHKKGNHPEIGVDVLDKVCKMTTKISSPSRIKEKPIRNNPNENQLEPDGNKPKRGKFNQLLPLCERELKKIEDAWLSTVYSSLSTRANLVKFLLQSFPGIEKSHFQIEDKKLIQCLDQVKMSTKAETNNLLNLVKNILTTREVTKEEYNNLLGYDTDCSDNGKKLTGDDSKQFKGDSLALPKKKDSSDATMGDKAQKTEANATKKKDLSFMSFFSFRNQQNANQTEKVDVDSSKANDGDCSDLGKKGDGKQQLKGDTVQKKKSVADAEDKLQKTEGNPTKKKDLNFMSFFSFGNQQAANKTQKQNENLSTNPPQTAQKVNDTKTEPAKLSSVQKDYETLKNEYSSRNETYEKKIRDLETLLDEKIKILKQEKEVKNQLQTCLSQFQAHQKRLSKTIGSEQLEYLIGRTPEGRDKRREELWMTAIKLILKGFFIQLKNLETERNKMLFQLQSNDVENFNALAASIMQKENFAKSIKQQMKSFNKAYQKRKLKENQT